MEEDENTCQRSSQRYCGRTRAVICTKTGKEGYVYDKDSVWQKEFEELFPYDETQDQLNAIDDTKRDMESKKIMDD